MIYDSTLYTGCVGITWNVYYLWLYLSFFLATSHIYKHIHTITYITNLHHHMCQISKLLIFGDDHPLTHGWWLRISVQAWRKQISESQLWPGLLLRELPVELSEATGKKFSHRDDEMTSKKSCIFFPGNRHRDFWWKFSNFLDFNYFRISKVRGVFQEFWRYIRLVDGFFEVLSDIFPWTMSHGKSEFFQNKRKDVCNKQVSFDVFKKSEFFQWFQFLILIFSPLLSKSFLLNMING